MSALLSIIQPGIHLPGHLVNHECLTPHRHYFQHEELAFDENQTDKEDERPTVVVLKPGDLTEQEAERAKQDGAEELDAAEGRHAVGP